MNDNKLAQDHPCVIETIRRHYLREPSPPEVPYHLSDETAIGQENNNVSVTVPYILRLLKNKV